jgi:hypothetical protein
MQNPIIKYIILVCKLRYVFRTVNLFRSHYGLESTFSALTASTHKLNPNLLYNFQRTLPSIDFMYLLNPV